MISQCKNAKIHIAAADDKKLSYNCIAKIRCLKCLFINVKIPLSQLQSRLHVVHQLIEPLAGPHGDLGHSRVGMVVATNIYTGSLTVHQLLSNHSLRVFQCLGQRDPSRILRSQTFSPVKSYIEVATTIVNFFPLSPRCSIVVQPDSNSVHQGVSKQCGFGITKLGTKFLEPNGSSQVLSQGVPPQMSFFQELFHMLGSRASCSCLEQSSSSQQRDNGQHLSRSSQFNDWEQVCQVISQDISCHRNSVKTSSGSLARLLHCSNWSFEDNVKPSSVMVLQVFCSKIYQVPVMGPGRVQPEDGHGPSSLSPRHCKFDPVLDRSILGLAHSPDISLLHRVRKYLLPRATDYNHSASTRHLKCLVMTAVLLSFLGHEPHIAGMSHSGPVKLTIFITILQTGLVHGGVAPVWDDTLDLLQLVIFVPHCPTISDNTGHRSINNDVTRNMQVGNPFAGVDHSQAWSGVIAVKNVSFNLCLLGMSFNLVINIAQSIVNIHTKLFEQVRVLSKDIFEVNLDHVAEHDGVRNFHHGCLHVQRHH